MPRHVNIPIFIPHLGCPNACVFCNQRSISGHMKFDPASVEDEIETALSTVGAEDDCEIAFFGGSFTGIGIELMTDLLERAQKYIDGGRVRSIRLSTRPDYINREILDILSRYSVETIELGLQSMSDKVLLASGRGHDASCAERACRQIKEYGFKLIGQMMIGLPASTEADEIETARKIIAAGADGARVYPTVVFKDTELACMTERGEYSPIDNDTAVSRTASVLDVFDRSDVPCIRVGLCASDNLSDDSLVVGGANHSSIGEMAMSELYFRRICRELERMEIGGGELTVFVAKGAVSKAVGQKRKNKLKLCEKYGLNSVKVLEKNEIIGYNIILEYCRQ